VSILSRKIQQPDLHSFKIADRGNCNYFKNRADSAAHGDPWCVIAVTVGGRDDHNERVDHNGRNHNDRAGWNWWCGNCYYHRGADWDCDDNSRDHSVCVAVLQVILVHHVQAQSHRVQTLTLTKDVTILAVPIRIDVLIARNTGTLSFFVAFVGLIKVR
jgi:hypothetical protein